jgi:hypothetical protein
MTEKLGILFLHHRSDKVVLNNLASIRRQNRGATVVTMSAGTPLNGGYSLQNTPELQARHSLTARRGSDWLVCSWYVQRREKCDKWWIVEWDTYCTMSAREYYRPVWDFPFVASSVRLINREPEWVWFLKRADLPRELSSHATGAVPFLYLVSERALKRICTLLMKCSSAAGNGELRFATAANKCGFPPCAYSPPGDQITWMPWRRIARRKAIFHPVKYLVRESSSNRANR